MKIRLALKNIFTSLTRVDAKIIIVVNCFTKRSIAAVWKGSEYASGSRFQGSEYASSF